MRQLAAMIASVVVVFGCLALRAQQVNAPPGEEPQDLSVRKGTALAKLIEEVQPHMKLIAALPAANQPDEDELPGWLRAHYLRNHPEFRRVVRPNDPTGGYPHALESMYYWMVRHQDDLNPSPRPPTLLPTRGVSVGKDARDPRSACTEDAQERVGYPGQPQ